MEEDKQEIQEGEVKPWGELTDEERENRLGEIRDETRSLAQRVGLNEEYTDLLVKLAESLAKPASEDSENAHSALDTLKEK